jgi:hypothetical protein
MYRNADIRIYHSLIRLLGLIAQPVRVERLIWVFYCLINHFVLFYLLAADDYRFPTIRRAAFLETHEEFFYGSGFPSQ